MLCVRRYFFINVNLDKIFTDASFNIQIFNRVKTIKKSYLELRNEDSFIFVGKGDSCSIILSFYSDDIQGVIEYKDQVFTIYTTNNNVQILYSTNYSLHREDCEINNLSITPKDELNKMDTDYPINIFEQNIDNNTETEESCNLKVLVLYTYAAKNSVNNIDNTIFTAIALTNQSFTNSNINTKLELVYSGITNYSETNNISTDLERFRVYNDGYMDEVHTLREIYSADVCVLLVYNPNICGLASTIGAVPSNAFCSVSTYGSCATSNYSFAHEIGHLIGCRHDLKSDTTSIPFQFGHGYVYSKKKWRTIMSYGSAFNNCPRLLLWSNPNITYNGEAVGTSSSNNNSLVWNIRYSDIASFRQPTDTLLMGNTDLHTSFGDIKVKSHFTNTENFTLHSGSRLNITSGHSIELANGFFADEGTAFYASINNVDDCSTSNYEEYFQNKMIEHNSDSVYNISTKCLKMILYPNPTSKIVNVDLFVYSDCVLSIKIMNVLGITVKTIVNKTKFQLNEYFFRLDVSKFNNGLYFCVVEDNRNNRIVSKFLINK